MKQEQLNLTGGGDQTKRRELDFYPTPTNVTHALLNFLNKECDFFFDRESFVWEPACGNGAMSEVIKKYGNQVYSSDISTTYGDQFDFLDPNIKKNKFRAIITNPPFNRSKEFIIKSCSLAPVVCMLLKSQYWHAKDRFELFTNNPPQFILPLTWRPDFLEHTRKTGDKKGTPTMECGWSIWIKGAHKETRYIPLLKP